MKKFLFLASSLSEWEFKSKWKKEENNYESFPFGFLVQKEEQV